MKYTTALACVAALALLSGCSTYYDRGSYRARVYTAPVAYNATVYSRPGPYVATDAYTQAWLDSCSRRYRSFNPTSGTYVGYDGRVHPCVL
jgi:hypothetical protein